MIHQPSGRLVAAVRRADGWWAKGRGVIGWPSLPCGQGLWLPGVSSVHTFFVPFSLDLLFLDADLQMVRVAAAVRPWRPLAMAFGAHHTIELGAGTLFGLMPKKGERWELRQEESG